MLAMMRLHRMLPVVLTFLLSFAVLTAGQTTVGRIGQNLPKPTVTSGGGGSGTTCQITSATYLGSFRLPTTLTGSASGFTFFGYGIGGGGGVTFNPSGNSGAGSLFLSGSQIDFATVAEIAIPGTGSESALVQGNSPSGGSTNLSALPTARGLQNFSDISGGRAAADTFFNGFAHFRIGGLYLYSGKLYATVFLYYDASHLQRVSFLRHGTTLSASDAFGWETVTSARVVGEEDAAAGVGMLAGVMADVPASLQASLGGPSLTGLWNPPIISRSSAGPAAFAFDPTTIGADTPSTNGGVASSSPVTSVTPLLYYPNAHRTLGDYDNAINGTYSWSSTPGGLILEDGCLIAAEIYGKGHATSGVTGLDTSTHYYGPATYNWNLNGTSAGGNLTYAYDPMCASDGGCEGTHAWPYQYRLLFYDVADLQAVAAGTKQPWEPIPVRTLDFPMPFDMTDSVGIRVTYDRAHRTMYVIQAASQDQPGTYYPMGHVFRFP